MNLNDPDSKIRNRLNRTSCKRLAVSNNKLKELKICPQQKYQPF